MAEKQSLEKIGQSPNPAPPPDGTAEAAAYWETYLRDTEEIATRIALDVPPDRPEFQKARIDLRSLLLTMARKLNIVLPDDKMPDIWPSPRSDITSASSGNTIYIHDSHIGSGQTYAEEIMHFFRNYLSDGDTSDRRTNSRVQEFFGRLSEDFARKLVNGTDLERLFKNEKRSDWISNIKKINHADLKRRVAFHEAEIRKLEAASEKTNARTENIRTFPAVRHYEELNQLLFQIGYLGKQDGRNEDEAENKLRMKVISEGAKRNEENLNAIETEMPEADQIFGELKNLRDEVSGFCRDFIHNGRAAGQQVYATCNRMYEEFKASLEIICQHNPKLAALLEGLSHQAGTGARQRRLMKKHEAEKSSIERELENLPHFRGYLLAEKFIEHNPEGWEKMLPELLRMTDEEVIAAVDCGEVAADVRGLLAQSGFVEP